MVDIELRNICSIPTKTKSGGKIMSKICLCVDDESERILNDLAKQLDLNKSQLIRKTLKFLEKNRQHLTNSIIINDKEIEFR